MPDSIRSRPLLKVLIAALGLLAGIVGIGVLSDFVDADPGKTNGAGTLVVGGEQYQFTPTTCFVSNEDFAVAGSGSDGTGGFWVTASSVSLDLAFGTETATDQPADDQLWLVSDEVNDWQANGQEITAEAPMTDRRDPDSPSFLGTLEVRCGDEI